MSIDSYHFHIYYQLDEFEKAESIVEKIKHFKKEDEIGRLWKKPVGPHPICSCQISANLGELESLCLWFMKNRDGLSIFVHGQSGDDLKDHTDYVMWIGKSYDLNLSLFAAQT